MPVSFFSRWIICLPHEIITRDEELAEYCRWLDSASVIAFDTEFVSEDCYQPELCLMQVAAADGDGPLRLTVIDPLEGCGLGPFWRLIVGGEHTTVWHAGRQELVFCLQAAGEAPRRAFDVQIAAGLLGREYPASYSSLSHKLLGQRAPSGETRTNWRRRPLSDRQIEYALDDVRYLPPMYEKLRGQLQHLHREAWLEEEMQGQRDDVQAFLSDKRWRRVSGLSKLSARELAVARELWMWREEEAQRRNKPPRRVLRDDLLAELARRRTADVNRIRAVRGMEHRHLRKMLGELSERIQRALDLPAEECPRPFRREPASKRAVIGQFLASALGSLCRQAQVAPGLLGGPNDVRQFIAHRKGDEGASEPPALATGWRAEVVGRMLDELLDGKLGIGIADADAEQPLRFFRCDKGEAMTNDE